MLKLAILSLLLFTPAAQAADFCVGLEELHGHIFFCEDNATYAKYAGACKEQFKALARAKSEALKKVLTEGIAEAAGESQTTHFKTTQTSYESTDLALAQAIDTGKHARGEVVAYGDDFVAPFSWPWMDLGPWPGMHHPEVQELFRSQGCYKDNIESVEQTTAEFDQMIRDLEATRAVTGQLHKRANNRELSLADLSTIPLIGALAPGGHASGGASDVTGTSRAKGPALSSIPGGSKLREPVISPKADASAPVGAAKAHASDITHSDTTALRSGDTTKLFSSSLNPQPVRDGASAPGAKGGTEQESVGSILWNSEKSSDAGVSLKVLSGSQAFTGSSQSLGSLSASSISSGSPGVEGAANPAGDPARAPASLASVQASQSVAGPDRDLFALVHARYRASDLFRAVRSD